MAIRIEELQVRRAVMNLTGIGVAAFGESTAAARNLPVKVRRNRQLKAEESNAIFSALQALGVYFEKPQTSGLLITTADIRRVMPVLNIAGIADLAFGSGSSSAANFRTKIAANRSLSIDESEAVMKALAGLGIWIDHRKL